MRTKLIIIWDSLRSSFWFLPSMMAIGAVVLAFVTVGFDAAVTEPWLEDHDWVYTGGGEGASAVLGAVAGSMITIAGVVFSLTLVALSLASSQFGPRLLRNFMRDTINQVVLGTFTATFLYCLLVLRTIRRGDDLNVPHLSVTIGVILAVLSMGVLIYFIHHVSTSIQADEIVAGVGNDLLSDLDRLFPADVGKARPENEAERSNAEIPPAFDVEARPIASADDGYLQAIDSAGLIRLAAKENLLLRLAFRPGHYIVAGTPLLLAWPGDKVNEELAEQVNEAFILGNQRTAAQDIEYTVNQLVEIAIRALSPGINDPFTAMTCVDRLGSALSRLAQRDMPSPYRCDEELKLRIIARPVTFAAVLNAAFNQIRQYSHSSAAVTIRLLETITMIVPAAKREEDRAALRRHADMIVRSGRTGLSEPDDVAEVEARYDEACRALKEEK